MIGLWGYPTQIPRRETVRSMFKLHVAACNSYVFASALGEEIVDGCVVRVK